MTQLNAKVFQSEINSLFLSYFSKFELYEPMVAYNKFVYYFNYRAYGLSIIVALPLVINKKGEMEMINKKIQIALKKTGEHSRPYLIELTDTLISGCWKDRVRERVGVLQELVTEIHKCKTCDVFKMPKISKTNDLKRTMFVSLQCPTCHKYTSTLFGRGLKTRLHRNLKKTRSN